MKERYECPYCKNIRGNEYVDLIDSDIDYKGGYNIESYGCSKCGEYFYVEKVIGVTRIEVRKTKY